MIEQIIASWGIEYQTKHMFGGVAYMMNGNMACATMKGGQLIVRTSLEDKPKLLEYENVEEAYMSGKLMPKWVMIENPEKVGHAELETVMAYGRDIALTLPPK